LLQKYYGRKAPESLIDVRGKNREEEEGFDDEGGWGAGGWGAGFKAQGTQYPAPSTLIPFHLI